MKIGIIGQGFVGTAVREKFKHFYDVMCWDKKWDFPIIYKNDIEKIIHTKNELKYLSNNCDVIFVCVPTPMYEDGECDTSIVNDIMNNLYKFNCSSEIIIKSTIPPGTTKSFNKKYNSLNINFSPEFLTEANSVEDFKNQNRIIIGSDSDSPLTKEIFSKVFNGTYLQFLSTTEAEMVKYVTNCFLATKVSFFNDIYNFCETKKINYNKVLEVTLLDSRITKSHTQVPGPDGDYGYGGHCFPKDMNALIYESKKINLDIPTIIGAEKTNRLVRKNKDWEKMTNRAVSKKTV